MKTVHEFNKHDLENTIQQAEQIAMCSINSIYNNVKDHDEHDEIDIDDLHCVKKAMQILNCAKELKENSLV